MNSYLPEKKGKGRISMWDELFYDLLKSLLD